MVVWRGLKSLCDDVGCESARIVRGDVTVLYELRINLDLSDSICLLLLSPYNAIFSRCFHYSSRQR